MGIYLIGTICACYCRFSREISLVYAIDLQSVRAFGRAVNSANKMQRRGLNIAAPPGYIMRIYKT